MPFAERLRAFDALVRGARDAAQPQGAPGWTCRIRRGYAGDAIARARARDGEDVLREKSVSEKISSPRSSRLRYVLEDGLSQLERLAGARMRERLVVLYVDEHGNEEAGIDMGGLFKDFWNDLAALAFDPNFALFRATPDELLYPSPASALAHGEAEHLRLFAFVGRVLGKALFERVTVQPQFAHFFLSFMGGHYNYLHMFADLESLDAELHRNLMFLKTCEPWGAQAELALEGHKRDT